MIHAPVLTSATVISSPDPQLPSTGNEWLPSALKATSPVRLGPGTPHEPCAPVLAVSCRLCAGRRVTACVDTNPKSATAVTLSTGPQTTSPRLPACSDE